MGTINNKIYLIAMIELLFNNNTKTDLGDYILEYTGRCNDMNLNTFDNVDKVYSVGVKLRNVSTGKIEWGNIYSKILVKNVSYGENDEAIKQLNNVRYGTDEDKIKFISRSENKILRKPYLRHCFLEPSFCTWFENLDKEEDFYAIYLGGILPRKAVPYIEKAYNEVILQFKEKTNSSTR